MMQTTAVELQDLKNILKEKIPALKDIIRPYGRPVVIHRIEIPCSSVNILNWLQKQKHSQKIYWANRQNEFESGGVGLCDKLEFQDNVNLELLLEHIHQRFNRLNPQLRYYGGICFNENNFDDTWKTFAKAQFIVPRFEFFQNKNNCIFASNVCYHEVHKEGLADILRELDSIIFDDAESSKSIEHPKNRKDTPQKKEWGEFFQKTKHALEKRLIQKVVIARQSQFEMKDPVDGFFLKEKLKNLTPECYHFCFQPEKNISFIGASPERLYKREKVSILSEAIAGTSPRGKSKEEDERLKKMLLQSEKDLKEHQIVVDAIQQSFNILCEKSSAEKKPSLLQLFGAYHLKTSFQGTLKNNVTDADIISQLHPTPAVAGCPKKEAIQFINTSEPFKRGWYTGLFGYIGQDTAEFTVAIRCGLINSNKLFLFAGAGIINDSQEEKEWDEIENKMNHFFTVFNNHEPK